MIMAMKETQRQNAKGGVTTRFLCRDATSGDQSRLNNESKVDRSNIQFKKWKIILKNMKYMHLNEAQTKLVLKKSIASTYSNLENW